MKGGMKAMNYYEEIELEALESYRIATTRHQEILLDVAMEADNVSSTSPKTIGAEKEDSSQLTVEKQSKLTKAKEFIKKVLDELMNWMKKFLDNASIKAKNMLTSHEGFKKELLAYDSKYDPLDSITVTIFNYDKKYLDGVESGLHRWVNSAFSNPYSTDSSNILNQDPDRINEEIYKILDIKEVDNANHMYSKMKERFRGEKKTVTITKDKLGSYKAVCINVAAVQTNMNGNINTIKTKVNALRRQFNDLSRSNKENAEYYKRKVNNMAYIMKVYSNMIGSFNILMGEYIFTCREVCKRFYKMPTTKV